MEANQFKVEIIEIPDSPLPQEFKIEESEQELGINDDLTSLFTKEEYVEPINTDSELERETEDFLQPISRDVFKDKRDRHKRAEKRKVRPDICTKNSECRIPEHMSMGIFHPQHEHMYNRFLKQILILFA